jgi:hypothetical protein
VTTSSSSNIEARLLSSLLPMSYRDDRDALREHAETLEHELSAARAEIERLRRGAPEPELAPLSPSGSGIAGGIAGLLVLFGAAAPLPRVVRVFSIAAGLSLLFVVALIARLIVLARVNELLVLSGGGQARGFRKLRAGRTLRRPMIESVARLDLGVFRSSFSLARARSKDGAQVDVALIVHCRVDPADQALDRAVTRLLGTTPQARAELVTAALEPVLRNVIAEHETRELQTERASVASSIRHRAQPALRALGVLLIRVYLLEVTAQGAPS